MAQIGNIIVNYAIPFIFTLGLLVFFHELGHFLLAKLVGIRVERFSIGFPPRLFGKKVGDTDYCVSAVPLGGYVKMSGMIDESMDQTTIKGEPWEFMSKPVWARFLVIFAGPAFNFVLAFIIYTGLVMWQGVPQDIQAPQAIVGTVVDGAPAAAVGLQSGDIITKLDGQPIELWEDLITAVNSVGDKQVEIEWQRDGETFQSTITPKMNQEDDVYQIGISLLLPEPVYESVGFFASFKEGAVLTYDYTIAIFKGFGMLFSGKVAAKDALAGPIKIAEMTGQVAERGFDALLYFAALLSINLGLLNLLPIPVLDGGHLVLLGIEGITRRPISTKIKMTVQQIGMALLLALMVFVIINDVLKLGQ
jgi:regulator of sigma E protease